MSENPHITPENQLDAVAVNAHIAEAKHRDGFYDPVAHGLPDASAEDLMNHIKRMQAEHGYYSLAEHGTGTLPSEQVVESRRNELVEKVAQVASSDIDLTGLKPATSQRDSHLN